MHSALRTVFFTLALTAFVFGSGIVSGQESDVKPVVDSEQAEPAGESVPESASAETSVEAMPENSMSGSLDDSSGSIETARGTIKDVLYQGWQVKGDLRVGRVRAEKDERDAGHERRHTDEC